MKAPPLLLTLVLVMAGCMGASSIDDPATQASAPTRFVVDLADLPGDDTWVVYHVEAGRLSQTVGIAFATWNFTDHGINPAHEVACRTYSVGIGTDHVFAPDRAVSSEDALANAFAQPVAFQGPLPIGVSAGGQTVRATVEGPDVSMEEDNLLLLIGDKFDLLFGQHDRDLWASAGARVTLDNPTGLRATATNSGPLYCARTLFDFHGGLLVQTPGFAMGRDLVYTTDLRRGAVIDLEVAVDLNFSVSIWGPNGRSFHEAGRQISAGPGGIQANLTTLRFLFCDPTPGTWDIRIDEVRATDFRRAQVRALVLDLPPDLMHVLPCAYGQPP